MHSSNTSQDFSPHGGPRHLLHFGTAYKLAPLHQLSILAQACLARRLIISSALAIGFDSGALKSSQIPRAFYMSFLRVL
jgi:hypothetical protein